jgi:IS5 family transposase
MRKIIESQMNFGEVAIETIEFDLKSRDEITKLLIGIQSIYCDKKTRIEAFAILNELIPKDVDRNNGRKGMDLWKTFVLGMLKLNADIDFDKLHELANNHKNLRLMLGHSILDWDNLYALQTIRDNIALFAPEILDKLNQVFIPYGHRIVGKKMEEGLKVSCDSAVNKTDVHYPTDINLLWDAMRRTILLIMALSDNLGLKGWREGLYNLRKVKKSFRRAQQLRRSKSSKKDDALKIAHLCYLELAKTIIAKTKESISFIVSDSILAQLKIDEILKFIGHAERQIDQIQRRVIEGETIPHHEKVFSIFEEHTEWISKGKAGVPVELGLRVCIVKDQFGFILHHRVMQNETDDKVAVSIIQETLDRFKNIYSCSFDKGFHSPSNQEKLATMLDKVILPRKGKLSAINKEIENSDEFKQARRKHSAVESSIGALQNHGLELCRDHGLHGFKRHVGMAIVARNIQIIGHVVQQKELKRQERLEKKQAQV